MAMVIPRALSGVGEVLMGGGAPPDYWKSFAWT